MPEAARGDQVDTVQSKTGVGKDCKSPVVTATDECSEDCFANDIGIVRQGDEVAQHNASGCGPDDSVLTVFSSDVFINGKGAGRKGDFYTPDNEITSGSSDVFINS